MTKLTDFGFHKYAATLQTLERVARNFPERKIRSIAKYDLGGHVDLSTAVKINGKLTLKNIENNLEAISKQKREIGEEIDAKGHNFNTIRINSYSMGRNFPEHRAKLIESFKQTPKEVKKRYFVDYRGLEKKEYALRNLPIDTVTVDPKVRKDLPINIKVNPKAERDTGMVKNWQESRVSRALVRHHEKAEIEGLKELNARTMPALGGLSTMLGHISPSVILKEHNIITTLPKDTPGIAGANYLKDARRMAEVPLIFGRGTDFVHGESPRLSRHAIKRITERFVNKHSPKK